jgi:hypothetical protein
VPVAEPFFRPLLDVVVLDDELLEVLLDDVVSALEAAAVDEVDGPVPVVVEPLVDEEPDAETVLDSEAPSGFSARTAATPATVLSRTMGDRFIVFPL